MIAAKPRRARRRLGVLAALLVVAAVAVSLAPAKTRDRYVIGVSNTVVGNGWREEMICSIKAQSLASGKVALVRVASHNAGPAEQLADVHDLIAGGADAILIDAASASGLDSVVGQARARGIKVVFVDQYVPDERAWNATNDQEAYGYLGARWLFKTLHGKGDVVELRGIAGAPADTARHIGVRRALDQFPHIRLVKSVFTGWKFATAGKRMLDILNSGVQVDGVWTSGTDFTVTTAFLSANRKLVPIVGADTNEFLKQLLTVRGLRGAAVTNPAAIGAVGASMAIDLLDGKRVPRKVEVRPQVWDNRTAPGRRAIRANYAPARLPTYGATLQIAPWTDYTNDQLFACKGP